MIRDHLRRARPEKILNVFQQIHLRFFRACDLTSGCTAFASWRRHSRTGSSSSQGRAGEYPARPCL